MYYTIHDLPEDERPRERLLKKGATSLADYELLAIILRTGTKEQTVLDLAKMMIVSLGDIGSFNNISISELKSFKGVKECKAVEIVAAIEFGKRVCQYQSKRKTINSSKDLYDYLHFEMENLAHEELRVVFLNSRSQIIEIKTMSIGGVNKTTIDYREIIKWALKLSAYHFIICHNHPSGDATPSHNDRMFTNELAKYANKMGINLVDHLIIGKNKYYSFLENN